MTNKVIYENCFRVLGILFLSVAPFLSGCGGSSDNSNDDNDNDNVSSTTDITDAIFVERSGDCADYVDMYSASVLDTQESQSFDAAIEISNDSTTCTFVSNSIPNHDFNDATAHFATVVSEHDLNLTVVRSPSFAASTTALSQQTDNAIFLNGVILDILSAGCYDPSKSGAGTDGNVQVGCNTSDPWLLDPLSSDTSFGADAHNAHTQPDGLYHYHGNPNAMFDENPGADGSPVIGFAADGFPIYGSYFLDSSTGSVRKAESGFTLRTGNRTAIDGLNPSDNAENSVDYDGTYVADWEFTDDGDLDECNGMEVDGQYGYYVTDTYPWVIACFKGTPNSSF
jgi:hypothetical protein